LATLPEAHAHRVGAEGLFDLAINKGMASKLDARMKQMAPTMLGGVRDSFVQRLRDKGFDARNVNGEVALETLPKFSGTGAAGVKFFDVDLRPLAQQNNIDFLL